MTLKLVDDRNASKWYAEKMKVDSLYEVIQLMSGDSGKIVNIFVK